MSAATRWKSTQQRYQYRLQDAIAAEAPGNGAAPAPSTPLELADAAADRYGLPRELVRSVMAAESGFQPTAISPKGAIGLMQLMPGTAQALGADPRDPAQNVDAGTRYLRDLLEKYNYGLRHALAAYNAGPRSGGQIQRSATVPGNHQLHRPHREETPGCGSDQTVAAEAAGSASKTAARA